MQSSLCQDQHCGRPAVERSGSVLCPQVVAPLWDTVFPHPQDTWKTGTIRMGVEQDGGEWGWCLARLTRSLHGQVPPREGQEEGSSVQGEKLLQVLPAPMQRRMLTSTF